MLVKWKPFGVQRQDQMYRNFHPAHREMSRLFDEFWGKPLQGREEKAWSPAVDVSENESGLLVKAELPGMAQDDVEVDVDDNVLTLKGEKKQEHKEEKENYLRVERSYGSFQRSFVLPSWVKQDDITASFKDGVLEVTLPKAEDHQPKSIPISASS